MWSIRDIPIKGLVKLYKPEVNAFEYINPADSLNDILDRSQPNDQKAEQLKDKEICKIVEWKEHNTVVDLTYASRNFRKYFEHMQRLVVEDGILYRLFYDDTGKVLYQQYCAPQHLRKEVLYRIYNSKTAGHKGITATIQEFRRRFYLPGFTEQLVDLVKNCLTCLQLKTAKEPTLKPQLQPISSLQSFPGDQLQIDLVGTFNSPVYKYVLCGIDVFSKYLFAVPLTNGGADTVARELLNIFFNHSYLPETIVSDLGTSFTSSLIDELAKLLEVRLKHESLKHPQTIGAVERSHGPLKRIHKLNQSEQWKDWHKYVSLATFIHNTSYHTSFGCSPTVIFHGREPVKPLDLRFSRKAMESVSTNADFGVGLQDAMLMKFEENKNNLIESYHRYKNYSEESKSETNETAQFLPSPQSKIDFTADSNQQSSPSVDSTLQSRESSYELKLHCQKSWNQLHTMRPQDSTATSETTRWFAGP